MDLYWLALIVLGGVFLGAMFVRFRKSRPQKVGLMISLHRFVFQRKGILAEDFMSFSFMGMGVVSLYIFTNTYSISLEKNVGANIADRPQIPVQSIEETIVLHTETLEEKLDSLEFVEQKRTLIKTYEAEDLSYLSAKVKSNIYWEESDFIISQGNIEASDSGSGGKVLRAMSEVYKGEMAVSDSTTLQPKGEFEVNFSLSVSDNVLAKDLLSLVIMDEHENSVLWEKTIKASDFKKTNTFELHGGTYVRDRVGSVQAKLIYLGGGEVVFDYLEIVSRKIEMSERDLEHYSNVTDRDASSGMARLASRQENIPGRIIFGPYDSDIEAGYYRANFRMKVSDNARSEKILLMDIASDAPDFVSTHAYVIPLEFSESGEYQDFSLDFYKPESGYLEFRVYYYGVTDLYIDKIDLLKTEGLVSS